MGPLCLQQCLLLSTCVLQGALWRRLFLLEKSRAALVPCWSRCPKLFLAPQGKLEQWQGEGRDLLLGSSLSLNWTLPPNCHPTETETLLQIDTKLRPPNCHPTVSPSSELSPNLNSPPNCHPTASTSKLGLQSNSVQIPHVWFILQSILQYKYNYLSKGGPPKKLL